MNTYTLEKGRQRELRELFAQHSVGKAEGKKRLKGIKFFITDPSEHDINQVIKNGIYPYIWCFQGSCMGKS
ncbi:MAG: hypothetical protein F6K17_06260 [Okeania sp. SIO3C4]|nr:hypothetical protein [Okeania sp. SIO3B3]NER02258.1 hypothetical protein [Okeania sp. SIO3C4]